MVISTAIALAFMDAVIVPAAGGVITGPAVEVAPEAQYAHMTQDASGVVLTWLTPAKQMGGPQCARAMRLTTDGAPTKAIDLACGTLGSAPVVAAGGSAPLVVWSELDAGNRDPQTGMARQTMRGMTLSARAAKETFHFTPQSSQLQDLAVGWDGSRYLVAWFDGSNIYLQRATKAGALDGKQERLPIDDSPQASNLTFVCTPSCTLVYNQFLGNSQSTWWSVALTDGKVGARTGAGADNKVLWATKWPTFAKQPWFGADAYRYYGTTEPPVGAETADGTFVAWTRRAPGSTDTTLSYEFVPSDPAHARHAPIELANEYDVQATSLGGTRFLLVSHQQPTHKLVARVVEVRPAYFKQLPPARAPIATGTVIGSDGKPAAGAQVRYTLVFKSGGTLRSSGVHAGRDGTFAIPHPSPNDHASDQDVVAIEAAASREGEVAPAQRGTAGAKLTFKLAGPAQLGGTIQNARGKPVELVVEVLTAESTVQDVTVTWQKQLTVRGDKFDVGDLPSGPVQLRATTADGRSAFATRVLEPAKRATIVLSLGKPGEATFSLPDPVNGDQLDAAVVIAGMDADALTTAMNNRDAGAIHYENISPGRHLVAIAVDPWVMTRTLDVRPGSNVTYEIEFEADLRPGQVGILLETQPAGVAITLVAPRSPADLAGLRVGNVIRSIDGTDVRQAPDAVRLLAGAPGAKSRITLVDGKTIVVTRSRGTGAHAPGGPPILTGSSPASLAR